GAWGGWNSTCSANATRTRSVSCRRSDGTTVANSECTSRGVALTPTSQTSAQYSGCSYSAVFGAWSGWSSTCSSSATRTRTASCRRSDGTTVANAECTNRGVALSPTSETTGVYSGCTYALEAEEWSTCSSSGTQSRAVQCRRSDGNLVPTGNCGVS